MVGTVSKDEVLSRLLKAAALRWGRGVVEEMWPAFELAAEAISQVEGFQLEPKEEPAHIGTIFQERRGKEE